MFDSELTMISWTNDKHQIRRKRRIGGSAPKYLINNFQTHFGVN